MNKISPNDNNMHEGGDLLLKGCQKKMIFIKNTGSELFDEAYFVISEKAKRVRYVSESDLIKEANRIINENLITGYISAEKRPPQKKNKDGRLSLLLWYLCGAASCGAVTAAVAFISNLI